MHALDLVEIKLPSGRWSPDGPGSGESVDCERAGDLFGSQTPVDSAVHDSFFGSGGAHLANVRPPESHVSKTNCSGQQG
jgi:hypothetical protein